MSFRADLHCHSSYSDGTLAPEEILHLAKEIGLQGISITDHDTIDGYSDELFALAKSLEIELLAGVEISSQWREENVHILGYGFALDSKWLRSFLADIQQRRWKRNLEIVKKLGQKGMLLQKEELVDFAQKCNRGRLSSIGRPHIAALLLQKGYVTSYMQAFQLYLKDGGSCYVQAEKYSSLEVIQKIHESNGRAIIAHPYQIVHKSVLHSLFELPFDGIEGRYPRLLPQDEKKWNSLSKQKGWVVTGGSDFHGPERTSHSLGSAWVAKDVFDRLKHGSLS